MEGAGRKDQRQPGAVGTRHKDAKAGMVHHEHASHALLRAGQPLCAIVSGLVSGL